MKALVDKETCIGCGVCSDLCPEVFEMQGEKAGIIADPVPKNGEACVQDAADQCPVDAISYEE